MNRAYLNILLSSLLFCIYYPSELYAQLTTDADRVAAQLQTDIAQLRSVLSTVLATTNSQLLSSHLVLPAAIKQNLKVIASITPVYQNKHVYVIVQFKSFAQNPAIHSLIANQRIRFSLLNSQSKLYQHNDQQKPVAFACQSRKSPGVMPFATTTMHSYQINMSPILPYPYNLCS